MECWHKNFNCKFCNPTILNPEFETKCKICFKLPVKGIPDFKEGLFAQKDYSCKIAKGKGGQ